MPTIAEQISKKSTTPSSNIATALEGYNGGGGGGGSTTPMESTTWEALVAKRNGGQLTSGMQYRITDYVCTTTQDESRAVSHPFDIIVTADDTGTLNENARACLHDGDNYYSAQGHQADLSAWQLKYCIDNDATRFAWADTTNGRGVIYWLKDDRNNECPYDFKQIQFKRYKITECTAASLIGKYTALEHGGAITVIDESNPVWCFTFSLYDPEAAEAVFEDASVAVMDEDEENADCIVYENVISAYLNYTDIEDESGPCIYYLPDNVFVNTFGSYCNSNTFGDGCNSNTFGNSCYSNTFGSYCYSNTFGNECDYNTFGNDCRDIDISAGTSSQRKRYYHILDGVQGTDSSHISITGTNGNNFVTYVGKNSSGVLKTWVPADMVQ